MWFSGSSTSLGDKIQAKYCSYVWSWFSNFLVVWLGSVNYLIRLYWGLTPSILCSVNSLDKSCSASSIRSVFSICCLIQAIPYLFTDVSVFMTNLEVVCAVTSTIPHLPYSYESARLKYTQLHHCCSLVLNLRRQSNLKHCTLQANIRLVHVWEISNRLSVSKTSRLNNEDDLSFCWYLTPKLGIICKNFPNLVVLLYLSWNCASISWSI